MELLTTLKGMVIKINRNNYILYNYYNNKY